MKNFYITTPIYYINAEPTVGSACTTVAADVVARMHRLLGENVFYLTGTDEHGEKVAETAKNAGISPQDWCDQMAPKFIEAWKLLDISNDFFIRTTDSRHKKVVAEVLQKIYDQGDVYQDQYEGWYCVGCESFKTEKELVDNHCPLHPPEKTVKKSEKNWFFRLSKYVPEIIKLIESENNYLFPESKKSEVLAKLKAGVTDVSLSREKVSWGIPLPWDNSQTAYVWFDALINYYSATRFLEEKTDFWPADLHLLGKEILWFHAVIWQAMLLSAKIELPKKVYSHDFYTIDNQKMSKSLGNTIPPKEMVEIFGVDASRYLIARSFPNNGDVDIGIGRFKEKYNADLANNFGNLVSRVGKLGDGIDLEKNKLELSDKYVDLVNQLKIDEAVNFIFETYIDKSNNLLNEVTPWKLEAGDPKRIEVLKICAKNVVMAAYHLLPILPKSCQVITDQFDGKIRPMESGLFPRIK
ncbi:MAG TPA: methionine--tRNA ligase [Candidatus Woesebacteria bacterium]|nr:methionine--tRNA ligase [Candidatus Woesebacteria bacterium]